MKTMDKWLLIVCVVWLIVGLVIGYTLGFNSNLELHETTVDIVHDIFNNCCVQNTTKFANETVCVTLK